MGEGLRRYSEIAHSLTCRWCKDKIVVGEVIAGIRDCRDKADRNCLVGRIKAEEANPMMPKEEPPDV